MKLHLLLLALAVTVIQSGCVVGRRTVPLSIPAQATAPAANKGAIAITSVTDARVFQNKPTDPAVPSIDGDVGSMSADQKSGMIGRQRNTYGKAMGDIALPAGDSVVQRSRLLVEEGLKRRGYTISADASAPNTASVTIDEFWAWFSPGMFSVSFEARVYCTLTLKKADGSAKVTVKGYGINKGQVASDANWQLAYTRAFEDFLSKMNTELDKAGF